jgi:hypothetical protein
MVAETEQFVQDVVIPAETSSELEYMLDKSGVSYAKATLGDQTRISIKDAFDNVPDDIRRLVELIKHSNDSTRNLDF